MRAKFKKGVQGVPSNLWSCHNIFAVDRRRKKEVNTLLKLLKKNNFNALFYEYMPPKWGIMVKVVVLDLTDGEEARFILWASDGVEI